MSKPAAWAWVAPAVVVGGWLCLSGDAFSSERTCEWLREWSARVGCPLVTPRLEVVDSYVRKVLHVLAFAGMTLLFVRAGRAMAPPHGLRRFTMFLLVLFVAVSSEALQTLGLHRSPSFVDVAVNFFAGGVVLVAERLWNAQDA